MLVPTWDRREQEIDVRRMLEFPDVDLFTIQQHCRFSGPTRDFVKKFRVQVILQGRNLWDSVVSLRDHFLRESTITPVCYVDDTFRSQPLVRQLDSVIDLAVPWYLNFYASWFTGRQTGEVDFFWVDYESLCRDTAGQLRRIVEYLGLSRSDEEIQEAMQQSGRRPTRLNVGRAGRGAEMLTQEQKDRIARLRAVLSANRFFSHWSRLTAAKHRGRMVLSTGTIENANHVRLGHFFALGIFVCRNWQRIVFLLIML